LSTLNGTILYVCSLMQNIIVLLIYKIHFEVQNAMFIPIY